MAAFRFFIIIVLLSTAAAGCATKVQARTEPTMPELAPPPPPPRVVETYADERVATSEPPEASTASTAKPAAKPPAPRVDTAATKPEPARIEPERATMPGPPASSPPSLTLRPAPGSESTTTTSIRGLLDRANRDLGRVNYTTLSQDGKTQYDTAKRFIQQAEEALRGANLVMAGKLADKAATMAAVLVR